MASSTELVENISEQFLICKLCSQTYKTPKSLTCTHTFCQCCLEKYYDSREDTSSRYQKHIKRTLACPMCYKRTEIPSGGIRQLPDSFLLTNLFAVLEKKKTDKAAVPPCAICKQPTRHNTKSAVSKCLECSKVLCRSCVKTHKATKVTQNHNLIDIETEKNITCKIHNDEPVRYYCEPCEVCICVLCTFEEHKNHEVITFSEGMNNQTTTLSSLLRECKVKTYKIKDRLEILGKCEERIKEAEDLIRDTSYNMITAIRQRERTLLQKIKQYYGEEIFTFIEEKESMLDNVKTLQNTCNITDTILKDPGIELLLIKKEMEGKLTTLVHEKLEKPPQKIYKKIKFIPGDANLGFLEFNGMPPDDIIDDVGCRCSACSVQREEKGTMTEIENKEDIEKPGSKVERRRTCFSTSSESSEEESDESESEGSGSDSDDEMSEEESDVINTNNETFNYSILVSGGENVQNEASKAKLVSVDCQTEIHLLHDFINEAPGVFKLPQRQISDVSSSCEDMRCLVDTETTGASSVSESENAVKIIDEVDAEKFIVDFQSNISSVRNSLVDFENTISSGVKLSVESGTTMNSTMNPYVECGTSMESVMLPFKDSGTTMEAKMSPMVETGTSTMESQISLKDAETYADISDKSLNEDTSGSDDEYVCASCKEEKPLLLSRETSPIRFPGKDVGTSPIKNLTKSKYTETNKIKTTERGIQCSFESSKPVTQAKPLVKPPIPKKNDDLFIPDMKAKKPTSLKTSPNSIKTFPKEIQNRPKELFDLPPVTGRPEQSKASIATDKASKGIILHSPSKPENELKPMQTIREGQDQFDPSQYTIKLEHSPTMHQKDIIKTPEQNVNKLVVPSLSFDSTSSDSEKSHGIPEKLDACISQKPKDSLARKQTLDLDQMLQTGSNPTPASKGATFPKSTPSTPKLRLKSRILGRLGSVEDITKADDKMQEGETIKTKLRKLIPERPHLPRIKGFKLKPPLADQKRHSISEPHPFTANKGNKNM